MTRRKAAKAQPRWLAALAVADSPADRLAVSCDRLRAGLRFLARPQRDIASRQRDRDLADSLACDAIEFLNSLSDRIDERKKVAGREREPASQA